MRLKFPARLWRSRRARFVLAAGVIAFVAGVLTVPHWLPAVLALGRSDIVFRVPDAGRTVFLTIDDGPSDATGEILAVLAKHEVTATFFITGDHMHDPDQLAAITSRGHSLGHHMKTTRKCSTLPFDEFRQDFGFVDQLLKAHGGSRLFRPPSDFGTREQIAFAASRGYRTAVGTAFPLDHWLSEPGSIRRLAAWLTIGGGIIILHDGNDRGRRTAAVLDDLIPQLKQREFVFGDLGRSLP